LTPRRVKKLRAKKGFFWKNQFISFFPSPTILVGLKQSILYVKLYSESNEPSFKSLSQTVLEISQKNRKSALLQKWLPEVNGKRFSKNFFCKLKLNKYTKTSWIDMHKIFGAIRKKSFLK
jgi:hypothetical protein